MPNLYHFSINADDVQRAKRFYEQALGWRFNAWGPPNFYMIETNGAGEQQSVRGSLQGRRELVPGQRVNGFECTIEVKSIDDAAAAIVAAGGRVIMEKSIIAGVGALMFFTDTEGNAFGAIQPDAAAE
jgi:predicted enzyme related to lactoylglutathione lyase